MRVELVSSDKQLARLAPVLCQLRPAFNPETLIPRIRQQQQEGYLLACVLNDEDQVLCVAGFVIQLKLAWGRHLYVDDLVSDERHRSTGAGELLINWLKDYAREQGCEQLHLDSGVQRFGAHRFYLRHGFVINSHHFAITEL